MISAPGGGAVLRNMTRDDGNINKLDGVQIHDGIRKIFFNQTWWLSFMTALGGKSQDGYTMRAVAEARDQGGVNGIAIPMTGPVIAGAATPDVNLLRHHNMRKSRLLEIVLMYISVYSDIYSTLSTFNGEGVMACNYLQQQMHVPTPATVLLAIDSMWAHISLDSLSIPMGPEHYSFSKLMQAVMTNPKPHRSVYP